MAEATLRPATGADMPAIRDWAERLALDTERMAPDQFLVATVAGELVGFARLKPYDDGSIELGCLGVLPEHRGQGIARQLNETLLRRIPPEQSIWVTTDQPELARKLGFELADDAPCVIKEKAGRCCERYGRNGVVIMTRRGDADV